MADNDGKEPTTKETPTKDTPGDTPCKADGHDFSEGAIRVVGGQKQRCDAHGRWHDI